MYKNDGSEEKVAAKNILIATGSEVTPFPGIEVGNLNSFLAPDHVAQLVMCLATDAYLTADPGVSSFIPAGSLTFVEIDRVIISTVILLTSAESFKKGCCQLQMKVCAQSTG